MYATRCAAVREKLTHSDLDGLLVTNLTNIRYLSGFTGSNAALMVFTDSRDSILVTDGRYDIQAQREVAEATILIASRGELTLLRKASDAGHRRIGVESQHLSIARWDALYAARESVELVKTADFVESLRAVKDQTEITALRTACAITDQAFQSLLDCGDLRVGRTEREIAKILADRMHDYGASGLAFPTIVATGPNSARPHHQPTDTAVESGHYVTIDCGALFAGYHADMTRTVVIGNPADWQREIYELVKTAQAQGRQAARAGMPAKQVDHVVRHVIAEHGYADYFTHGLGHGVGLDIHEAPALSKASDATLLDGMAVTIEPGVYLPERGGVRIEDTLVVRDGTPELLTLTTKDLVVVEHTL